MSRLSRDIVRRDKSFALMATIEDENKERCILNILNCMTTIMKDINPKKIPTTLRKKSSIWQTICIMARIASIEGHWPVPVQDVGDYLPPNNTVFLKEFVARWVELKEKPETDAMDFLRLLAGSKV